MSLFNVQINFVKAEWADNFLDRVSLVIAKAFGQNIEDVTGNLIENCHLLWNGTADPAIYIIIQTVRAMNGELDRICAETVSECVSRISGVPESRIFINFVEKVLSDVATNGSLLWQNS